MRTSNQLRNADYCHSNGDVSLSKTTSAAIYSYAQKNIIKRIMQGEDIPNIKGELENIISTRGAVFENYEQKKAALTLWTARLNRFIDYIKRQDYRFLEENDCIVHMGDEDIKVIADFVQETDNYIEVCKIKTGRASSEATKKDRSSNEAYAFGLLGKKLTEETGKTVYVKYLYLGEPDSTREKRNIMAPYMIRATDSKVNEFEFSPEVEHKFEQAFDETKDEPACSPDDCASCGRNNICHYTEPPINLGAGRAVVPITDIRLSEAQRNVTEFEEGNARCNAGAGGGKTLVTALRVKRLIEKGYDPNKILLLTFTKTGAEEMRSRSTQYLASEGTLVDPDLITSSTINSFCQTILDEHFAELGYTAKPRVIPEEVKSGIINNILDKYPKISAWKYGTSSEVSKKMPWVKTALKSAKDIFNEIKDNDYTLEDNPYKNNFTDTDLALIFHMYDEYELKIKGKNMIDYADQLKNVMKLTEIHPGLFEEYGYEHIMVDEFQDTDPKQIELLQKILDTTTKKSFMAIGDDSQAIYKFRGCTPEFITHFGNYFGAFTDFRLMENHRSTKTILDNANIINTKINDRVEKDLIPTKPEGSPVEIKGFYTAKQEYSFIARDIADRIARGENPSNIAVLTSNKYEIQDIASELTKVGVPSVMMNPTPYQANSRVAALCSFYDSFINGSTQGLVEYENILRHGTLKNASSQELNNVIGEGKAKLENMPKTLTEFKKAATALDLAECDECYQSFLEKIEYCNDLEELDEFMRDFNLYGYESTFTREGHYDGVSLITVHSAKGAEWDTTYLTLSAFDNEGYHHLPQKFNNEHDDICRKWFVGVTRAKENLIITGQFVIPSKSKKDGILLNRFVFDQYEILGKQPEYSTLGYLSAKAAEKAAELAESEGTARFVPREAGDITSNNNQLHMEDIER